METSFDKPQEPIAKTVCGGKIKDPAGFPTAIYKGEQIYFCTRPFIVGAIDHPLDDE